MSPDGKQGPYVKDFERDRWMLWWDGKGGMSWAWSLYPGTKRTRAYLPECACAMSGSRDESSSTCWSSLPMSL
jgi:hypothetical protein